MRGLPVGGLVVLAALFAAACGVNVSAGKGHGPYSVEIRQVGETQLYVVRGPSNKIAAARAGGGTSALLNPDQLSHALAAMPTPKPNTEESGDHVSIHAPGFDLNVQGDDVHINENGRTNIDPTAHTVAGSHSTDADDDDDGDHTGSGHVSMNVGGFGMHVDADDGGPGHDDDRAQVTLSGMSAHDIRHFIQEQDDLSSEVKTQMIAALALPADDDASDDDNDDASNRLAGGADNKDKKPNK